MCVSKFNSKGFTLLELIVAIAVSSVITMFLFSSYSLLFNSSIGQSRKSEQIKEVMLLRTKLRSVLTQKQYMSNTENTLSIYDEKDMQKKTLVSRNNSLLLDYELLFRGVEKSNFNIKEQGQEVLLFYDITMHYGKNARGVVLMRKRFENF